LDEGLLRLSVRQQTETEALHLSVGLGQDESGVAASVGGGGGGADRGGPAAAMRAGALDGIEGLLVTEGESQSMRKRRVQMSKQKQELVVVASLLDKTPNLGGLARTCEIFQASRLVLNDINVRNDTMFKQLAVTADRWIDMQQVCEESAFVGCAVVLSHLCLMYISSGGDCFMSNAAIDHNRDRHLC
jgi:hypothetical protein